MIDETLGHYRVVDRIAAGGMGVVYRAEDLTLHRSVALKFLSPETASDDEYRARFLREARVAAALNHPTTCTVFEVGEVPSAEPGDTSALAPPGTPFIAMEFVDGETLADRLTRVGPLTARETLHVALQIADGLAHAHRQRIIHRDLKPQNVMVTPDGSVKIVDFGLAKPLKPARAADALLSTSDMISADLGEDAVIGTCAYMSPEQASRRAIDARSDVFAFGIMLYQMLTGRLPFRGDTATATLAKILEAEPDPIPDRGDCEIGAALARVARRCLRKAPQDRYPDARDIVDELRAAQKRLQGTGRRGLLFAGLLGLVLAGTLVYSTLQKPDSLDPEAREAPVSATAPVASPRVDQSVPDSTPGSAAAPAPLPAVRVAASPRPRPPTASPTRANEQGVVARVTATVTFDSRPKASVTLDDALVGITPISVETAPGTHDIVMVSSDGKRWRGRVTIAAGEEARVDRDLGAVGRLTVTSDVWVEVSIDGGSPEQTPVQIDDVSTGLHQLRAFREGFVTQTLEVGIEQGRTSHLRIKLERAP